MKSPLFVSALLLAIFSISSSVGAVPCGDGTGGATLTTEADLLNPEVVKAISESWNLGQEGVFAGQPDKSGSADRSVQIVYREFTCDPRSSRDAAIVISSGRTEGMVKYQELIYDLNQNGYSVYIHDHRGQGFSSRLYKSDLQLGHVASFDNYVADLNTFVATVVKPKNHKRLYLLAHSMGGCIGSLYIEQHKQDFKAAVLSSPMHEPNAGGFLTRFTCRSKELFVDGDKRYEYAGKKTSYDEAKRQGKHVFDGNELTHSKTRYNRMRDAYEAAEKTRDSAGNLRKVKIGGPSKGWLRQACKGAETARKDAGKIEIPVLVLQAGKDTAVRPGGQDEFCKNLRKGGKAQCMGDKPQPIEGAWHELFIESDKYRKPALSMILNFLAQH